MKMFFVSLKFSQFCAICNFFKTITIWTSAIESSYRLVYYWVSGEPRISGCSRQLDIYHGECGIACASLFIDRRRIIFVC